MAQFYTQVLDANETTNCEENSYTSAENPVQYVIKTDDQQQPIIVSSGDQLMVLDNSNNQQVIAIQSPHFQAQPIYYMETNDSMPVVLNQGIPQKLIMQGQSTLDISAPPLKPLSSSRPVQQSLIYNNNGPKQMGQQQQFNRSILQVGNQPRLVPRNAPRPRLDSPRPPAPKDNHVNSLAAYRHLLDNRLKKPGLARTQQQTVRNSIRPKVPIVRRPEVLQQQHQQQMERTRKCGRIIQPNQKGGKMPRVLRNFVPPPEIKNIISRTNDDEEFLNSVRMYVLLANGEQRLITFTTPKEDCTIQEILEQVGVETNPETNVAMRETNLEGINLIVSVGYANEDDDDQVVSSTQSDRGRPMQSPLNKAMMKPRPKTPELEPETRKVIPGKMAVCYHCGYLSEDFNRCVRCLKKLPDGVKAMSVSAGTLKNKNCRPAIAFNLKSNPNPSSQQQQQSNNPKSSPVKRKMSPRATQPQEPMVVTLSSDDDEDNDQRERCDSSHLQKNKEPTIEDIKVMMDGSTVVGGKCPNASTSACTSISCRTIRIGSYRFTPKDDILINNKEMVMRVPHPKDSTKLVRISIQKTSLAKVLVNFQKILPVMFYYIVPEAAETVRKSLDMVEGSEPYFDPLCIEEEAYRRITLLPETMGEEDRWVLENIYGTIMDELNPKEANTILMKTCPKDQTKNMPTYASSASGTGAAVKQLLIYPPGKGGIAISSEDYKCLAQDQFLNDVIIDFYLKYLVHQLPKHLQEKVHVFSTFFYNRLTTKPTSMARRIQPSEVDGSLSAAEKRHARVKNWTKQVNIFDKNFIIIPINEHAHWFLAVICFPDMAGPQTFDGNPLNVQDKSPAKKKSRKCDNKMVYSRLGPKVICAVAENTASTVVHVSDIESDKDEADGDDSELESDDSEDASDASVPEEKPTDPKMPIKQPCILIFDSLLGVSRAKVVATLRDYLTCEYRVKKGIEKTFNKDTIRGNCPKVPQQTNYTDCGLYVLQYVETLLTAPIDNYRIPIKSLKEWFDESAVTRKREDLSILIKDLMVKYKKDPLVLPDIQLPTLNGLPIERSAVGADQEDQDSTTAQEDQEGASKAQANNMEAVESEASQSSEASTETDSRKGAPSDRDTMSYLKAKRIVKNKQVTVAAAADGAKKIKLAVPEDD